MRQRPQGIHGGCERHSKQPDHSPTSSESAGPETPGQLSNPRPTALERLNDVEADDLVSAHREGRSDIVSGLNDCATNEECAELCKYEHSC